MPRGVQSASLEPEAPCGKGTDRQELGRRDGLSDLPGLLDQRDHHHLTQVSLQMTARAKAHLPRDLGQSPDPLATCFLVSKLSDWAEYNDASHFTERCRLGQGQCGVPAWVPWGKLQSSSSDFPHTTGAPR